ncbi:transketolase [Pelagibius sp. 7325]|uniref:transketolase n=1 Tax=Pelagibius sp. 7325 TaxID=3131994 RepID=UPI0030EBBECC
MAKAIRVLAMDAVQKANSGHPGMPMGMADVATVLFTEFMKFDPQDPQWPDRDRFVLSAGHGSMLLYALLHLTGYADMTLEELKNFRQLGARTAGHPEFGHAAGIEVTTGPLGQGIATAVGLALGERMMAAQFGADLVDHHTYVLAGDGCLMEGISHEAIDLAGHLKLSKLIVLFDDNAISIDGPTSLATSMDQPARFAAAGWSVFRVDGHEPGAIYDAIAAAKRSDRPSLIACKTVIGYGAPNKQGSAATHGSPLGEAEIAAARRQLGWCHGPFEVPEHIRHGWLEAGRRGRREREAWGQRLEASPRRGAFVTRVAGDLPADLGKIVDGLKQRFSSEKPALATRQSSQQVLEALVPAVPGLIGGSADLTGSVGTKTAAYKPVSADDFSGSYIHYGVREHGMAAAMNGLALHGGFIPFGGTFLAFADYCRPAIRLAALMGIRVIHVMTHDSIGLGEDGPTHQPVEQLASLRAIPNLKVFRPCDAVETAEAWACALENTDGPSVLCLTRQGLPTLRTRHVDENLAARGAYVLREVAELRDVTLLATGSEVSLAIDAADRLALEGIRAAVVSMPCWELFKQQSAAYRADVLGSAPRVAVEAATRNDWDQWITPEGGFVGMTGFGASAPAEQLYEHFGITAAAVAAAARDLVN